MELGIDLAGGAELTYRALYSASDPKRRETTQQIVDVLHRRVDKRGLKDPKITTAGDDMISLQLAGIDKDALEDYKRLIESVASWSCARSPTRRRSSGFNQSEVRRGRNTKSRPYGQPVGTDYSYIKDKVLLKQQAGDHRPGHFGTPRPSPP